MHVACRRRKNIFLECINFLPALPKWSIMLIIPPTSKSGHTLLGNIQLFFLSSLVFFADHVLRLFFGEIFCVFSPKRWSNRDKRAVITVSSSGGGGMRRQRIGVNGVDIYREGTLLSPSSHLRQTFCALAICEANPSLKSGCCFRKVSPTQGPVGGRESVCFATLKDWFNGSGVRNFKCIQRVIFLGQC